jgi:SAM-dependent methyltransferase
MSDWAAFEKRNPRLDRGLYPRLDGYSWEEIYRGAMGPGGLFLAADMVAGMGLRPGQRVLDLGCGRAATSIFLAREYGVNVVAADLWISPTENWRVVREAGLKDRILPLRVDVREHPFPEELFDALFCMDSWFYYGTDDFFLRRFARVLAPGAPICIGGPCFSREIDLVPPFDFDDAWGYHTPEHWRRQFERSGVVEAVSAEEHPLGPQLWQDWLRFSIAHCDNEEDRRFWLDDVDIVDTNGDGLLTHFILRARRAASSREADHGATES